MLDQVITAKMLEILFSDKVYYITQSY